MTLFSTRTSLQVGFTERISRVPSAQLLPDVAGDLDHLNPLLGPINWVTKKDGPGVRSGSVLLVLFVFTCVGLHRH